MKIGVIDSGVGGFAVLKKIAERMPELEYIYYADNAYCPYGNKSEELIISRLSAVASFLQSAGAEIIVVACNTATGTGVNYLREKFSFLRVFGIEPSVKQAADEGAKKIALFATERKKSCKNLARIIKNIKAEILFGQTGDLAYLIEKNIFNLNVLGDYIHTMADFAKDCDAIVLGCTHYIFAEKYLSEKFKGRIYDGTDGLVNNMEKCLYGTSGCNLPKRSLYDTKLTIYCSNNKIAEITYLWQLIAGGYLKF